MPRASWQIDDDPERLAGAITLTVARGDRAARLARCLAFLAGKSEHPAIGPKAAAIAQRARDAGVRLVRVTAAGESEWAFVRNVGSLNAETVAVLNSRKPRMPDGTAPWCRATVEITRDRREPVFGSLEPLPHAVVARAAAGDQVLMVHPDGVPGMLDGPALRRWQALTAGWAAAERLCWIAPLNCVFAASRNQGLQERDRFIAHVADRLIAVTLRKSGSMLDLVRRRGPENAEVVSPEFLESEGVDIAGSVELLEAGFPVISYASPVAPDETADSRPVVSPPSWAHLAHHTCDQDGPWPGESRAEMLASLCRGGPDSRRDAFQTLLRIAREGLIRAASGGIRQANGSDPVRAACFTAQRPRPDHPLHAYDPARHRWLFGPCAICIAKDAAAKAGAVPVQYLAGQEFESLPPAERFRFQLHEPPRVDRSAEEEWRTPADLDLKAFDPVDVFFVTHQESEAAQIAAAGPWRAFTLDAFGGH